jgi:hypothetical protein
MTVVATGNKARQWTSEGDADTQKSLPHYVENTGDTDLRSSRYSRPIFRVTFILGVVGQYAKPELVMAHLNRQGNFERFPKNGVVTPLS